MKFIKISIWSIIILITGGCTNQSLHEETVKIITNLKDKGLEGKEKVRKRAYKKFKNLKYEWYQATKKKC